MKNEDDGEVVARIRKDMGRRLVILGHHYQRDEIIAVSDFVGDSLELARKVPSLDEAEIIVFCGVYFMAETAAILAPDKKVLIPDANARCPLADMGDADLIDKAWMTITSLGTRPTPVTYVNSSAATKAFCGRNEGTVCTSGNAEKIFRWALASTGRIFFMPDRNLGRNTAHRLGIPDEEIALWDPAQPSGGLDEEMISRAKVILWNGWCPVHYPDITPSDVADVRKAHPGISVIVHPESSPETVDASDDSGSTSGIIDYVKKLDAGRPVAVGTEFNMVNRLAASTADRLVVPVRKVTCEDMSRITMASLAGCLQSLGGEYRVRVDEKIASDALVALETMLEVKS